MNDALLWVLALACIVLAMAQMAGLGALRSCVIGAGLALFLLAIGNTASQTSLAALGKWLALPQRRLDLAALLLIEALLYSQQAIASAQPYLNRYWRMLAAIPPPSLLIVLFLALVWTMLNIDGIDFSVLTWACALAFPLLLLAGAWLLQRLLPDVLMRTGLRLCLHAAQLVAGLWLARPVQQAAQFETQAMWERLGLIMIMVAVLMLLGWCWQQRQRKAPLPPGEGVGRGYGEVIQ